MEIRNFKQLVGSLLNDGQTFMWYEMQNLLAPGENYGSTMAQVEVVLVNKEGRKITVHCVAKLVPPSPYIWKLFNTPVTFKKEIALYQLIVPTLNAFGRTHNIENLLPFFPGCIGSRISLDQTSNEVDQDAALVLRNLKEDGYVCCDRFNGCDRETALMLLNDLATMHASVIAYKLQNPKEFQEKFMPNLQKGMDMEFSEEFLKPLVDQTINCLKAKPEYVHLIERVLTPFKELPKNVELEKTPREPFATLVHCDFWTNNVMVEFNDGKPTSSKFVDFQMYEYTNPAKDILFFLYSSVKLEELANIDDLIKAYHDRFISVLESLNCDTTQFSLDAFLNEVEFAAKTFEFVHAVFMLVPLFTEKGKAKELKNMENDSDIMQGTDAMHENFYPRLYFIVEDYARRGWI